ncbi:hypothetical protein J6590_092688 [Homalodisca vitripennis]|nr:hypothetical protein J6590_055936 [Homalodisca vitripennis]KAG8314452.1 hypothetical protein J6590_092688 [Homalodisca vitripennis]
MLSRNAKLPITGAVYRRLSRLSPEDFFSESGVGFEDINYSYHTSFASAPSWEILMMLILLDKKPVLVADG